jgi:hypothetical protein
MNCPAKDICSMLEAESALGLVFATNLFVDVEPTDPVDCVTVYDVGGLPPMLTMNAEEIYEYPSVQVRVRNAKYDTGWALANDIKSLLHGRARETWGGALYSLIACSNGPLSIGQDENNRACLVLNFNLQR